MAISNNKNPIIELNDIKFHYRKGDSVLFDGLNLKIYEGEIVGVIGASGAGKTSLLYLMNGVIPQFYTPKFLEGEVLFRGEKIGDDALGRISQHVGMVLDDPEAQLFNLYVKDELVWGPENLGLGILTHLPEQLDLAWHLPADVVHQHMLGRDDPVGVLLTDLFSQ
ncbi:MAG: ATP-binding cassette domain-containing protein, partial [Candidatus Hodarchaeales archaeon]